MVIELVWRNLLRVLALGAAIAVFGHFWPGAEARARTDGPAAVPAALPAEAMRIEQRFQQGLAALEAGDTETAIRRFTSILAENPRLHRVRLELARAYFVAEDWTDARREFFAVLSADVPRAVKDNIIVFLRLIDLRRGWTWDLDAGVRSGPESGRNYKTDTVILDIFGEELPFEVDRPDVPDFGGFINGSLEYRRPLVELQMLGGPELSGIARVDGAADVYDDSDFDELRYGGNLALQLSWPQTSWSFGPDIVWRRIGGDERERLWGVSTSVEHRLPEGLALLGRLGWQKVDDALVDSRDGDLYSTRFGVSRSLGGRSSITAIAGVDFFEADAASESYRRASVVLRGRTELVYGIAPTLSLAAEQTRYRERNPFFTNRRNDRELGATLEVEKRDLFIGPFSPFVSVGYSYNFSNIEIYEYDETIYRFGLRKIF